MIKGISYRAFTLSRTSVPWAMVEPLGVYPYRRHGAPVTIEFVRYATGGKYHVWFDDGLMRFVTEEEAARMFTPAALDRCKRRRVNVFHDPYSFR